MCNFFSCIGTKRGDIYFTEENSHEVVIQRLQHQGVVDLTDMVRIEINGAGYQLDEHSIPEWYERNAHTIKQKALFAYKQVLPYHHKYNEMCYLARETCDEICNFARELCDKMCYLTIEKRDKMCNLAREMCDEICNLAREKCDEKWDRVWEKRDKMCNLARKKCDEKWNRVWERRDKMCNLAREMCGVKCNLAQEEYKGAIAKIEGAVVIIMGEGN